VFEDSDEANAQQEIKPQSGVVLKETNERRKLSQKNDIDSDSGSKGENKNDW